MVLKSKKDYYELIDKVVKEGNAVNATFELVGKGLTTRLMSTAEVIELFDLDTNILDTFIKAISNFEETKVGPYITEKYFLLIPDLKEAVSQLKHDCIESRRCVIVFPKEHCFQSIQFLVRENTINVVCFMRSCDMIKNLPYDLWLCSFLADMFAHYMESAGIYTGKTYERHKITMSFGSLHAYREDIINGVF